MVGGIISGLPHAKKLKMSEMEPNFGYRKTTAIAAPELLNTNTLSVHHFKNVPKSYPFHTDFIERENWRYP